MRNVSLLRIAIGTNALFSAASGVLCAANAEHVAEQLRLPGWAILAIGASLVGYGVALGALTFANRIASRWAVMATVLDLVWVVGSAVLLALHRVDNVALVAVPAACVSTLALLQLEGLRRETFTDRTGRFAIERRVNAPADRAWSVVSDVARYAEVAGTLHRSEIVSGSGEVGMVRKCEDKNGVCWTETCARWEPGRAYAFDVDTSAPKYPLPLRTMRGDFEVDPDGSSRSTIRIRFTFTARGGWLWETMLGAIFAAQGKSIVGAILARWAERIEAGPRSASAADVEARQ